MVDFPDEQLAKYEKESRLGEAIENLMRNPDFDVFVKEILDPMEIKAFEDFKTLDPEDHISVMEAQMGSKVVDKIRTLMSTTIHIGRAARAAIIDVNDSTQEDESGG